MKNILLLDFEDQEDAKWVLEVGRISFKGSMLQKLIGGIQNKGA